MTKKILYFLIGTVFSFYTQEKGQATTDLAHSSSSPRMSKRTIDTNYFLPLGKGEVALFDDYTKYKATVNIHKVRTYLMPWVYRGLNMITGKASGWFGMPIELAEGLYEDYKPIYDAFREAYEQDSENGQNLFVNKAVSQFKIDEAYARALYDALKPSPSTLIQWQEYKQASSSSSAAAATPPQETAEEKLKKLLLSNTLNSGAAAAAKTPPLQEEKKQTLEEELPYISSTKPLTGLRRRNLSPPK